MLDAYARQLVCYQAPEAISRKLVLGHTTRSVRASSRAGQATGISRSLITVLGGRRILQAGTKLEGPNRPACGRMRRLVWQPGDGVNTASQNPTSAHS